MRPKHLLKDQLVAGVRAHYIAMQSTSRPAIPHRIQLPRQARIGGSCSYENSASSSVWPQFALELRRDRPSYSHLRTSLTGPFRAASGGQSALPPTSLDDRPDDICLMGRATMYIAIPKITRLLVCSLQSRLPGTPPAATAKMIRSL